MLPLSLHPMTFKSHFLKLPPLISHTFPFCSHSVDLYTNSSSSSLEFVSFNSQDVRHSADPTLWKPPSAPHAHPWWGLQSVRARDTRSKAEVVWLWHRKRTKKNVFNLPAVSSKVILCVLPIANIAIGKSAARKSQSLGEANSEHGWIDDCPCCLADRRGLPARLSSAAPHPHLPDCDGGLRDGADAALLPALRPSEQGRAAQPPQSCLCLLELADVHLPLLLVHCRWVLMDRLNTRQQKQNSIQSKHKADFNKGWCCGNNAWGVCGCASALIHLLLRPLKNYFFICHYLLLYFSLIDFRYSTDWTAFFKFPCKCYNDRGDLLHKTNLTSLNYLLMFEVERSSLKPWSFSQDWPHCSCSWRGGSSRHISRQRINPCQEFTPFRLNINTPLIGSALYNSSPEFSLCSLIHTCLGSV